jgi:ADP-ribose pyrophosphatase YjhB (NUDIX family)
MLGDVWNNLCDAIEWCIRWIIVFLTNFMPVKVIRDDKGVPFLYRYHIFSWSNDGPGICIHHFVKSDPDRGYHDHPWLKSFSFILCGGYEERILNDDRKSYTIHQRKRWRINYLNGVETFHRVMIEEGKDVWTLFFFQKRRKTWGMVGLDGEYHPMSTTVHDQDGGWWNHVMKGLGIHSHLEHKGKVISTVDIIVTAHTTSNDSSDKEKILLIKRGKHPFKDYWSFPGGRIEERDVDILSAAERELEEETNITNVPLKYVTVIGNNKRDPRGFCLTNIFIAKLDAIPEKVRAGDDAVDYEWFDIDNLPKMAFDHEEILKQLFENKFTKTKVI